ncbi:MAG: FecR domain-containing protein [Oligoflexia bacterium]|nr:FecR domain-containing protein [Oligoflexia bacterium]
MRLIAVMILAISFCLSAFAADKHAGFITGIDGDVKIFRTAGMPEIPNDAVNSRWEGRDYKSFSPKLYGKVYEGDILVTNADSKAKLIMSGSNTVMVGAFTHFIVKLARETSKGTTSSFKLLFGKVRSIVKSKIGRSGKYEVRTPSSVIGVRGTDFYTIYRPQNSTTTVSTLEGVVAVKNLTGKVKKEILVESGYSTSVINVDDINVKKFKEVTRVTSLESVGLPTKPEKVRSAELQGIKETSTIETAIGRIDVDLSNKAAAQASENKVLQIIKTDTPQVDVSKDPLNMNLDALIKKVVNEEKMRQREEGSLNRLDQWIKNY